MVSGTSTAYNAKAYQVTGADWTSASLQWSNKPAATVLLAENISHNNKTKYQFSCLTAVQHWYNGDPTGQHENYGIMLCYNDTTIADYNSVYSADCTDATMRPSLTISYTPPSSTLAVLEGETLALAVSRAASAITWTSSDTAIATVDSSGVVTGIKAGEVTIKAFVDGSEYQRYTVHVIIQDGVYRIRNNAGLHLGTYGGTTENTSVMLQSYSDSEPYKTCQLWKVSYLGDGYYSIRPMHKLNMGLHAGGTTGSSVDIVSIGMNDSLSEVALINRWGIERNADGSGYYLNHVGTSSLGLKADGIIPSHGMGLTIEQNPGTEVFEWSFLPVTGLFLHDSNGDMVTASAHAKAEVEMGGTYTLAQMGLHLTANNVTPSWSTNGSVASVNALGKVTANKRGVAEITVSATVGNSTTSFVIDVTSIETVYVKNYYDKTLEGNSTLLGYIDDAVVFLNKVFKSDFHLEFVSDGNPTRYADAATDICGNYENTPCQFPNSNCTSIVDCDDHHKNINRIADEAYQRCFERNHVVVLWSNNKPGLFCENKGGHTLVYALAATQSFIFADHVQHQPVVQVFTINQYDTTGMTKVAPDNICMSLVLAHEIAHTLEMYEMYNWHEDHTPEQGREFGCIMNQYDPEKAEDFYGDIMAGRDTALCETCTAILTGQIMDDVYEN